MDERIRVLIIAEAANPDLTSVALIGYSFSRALAEVCDAHLVTELRNGPSLEKAGVPASAYTCIDNRAAQGAAFRVARWLRGGEGVGWTIYSALGSVSYPLFERKIWKQFGARLRAREFDLVHRVTPLSPITGSYLAPKLQAIGVPYVLGPLNGGVPWPREFDSVRRQEKEWLSYVRGAYKLSPGVFRTRKAASALVLGSRHTFSEVTGDSPELRGKGVYIPENAIDPARFPRLELKPSAPSKEGPLRAAFVGRLVPYKGADMLLRAAAPLLRDGLLTLDIIGDGPERSALERIAQEESVQEAVQFPGWVDHRNLQDRLSESQIFAFPSVREFGGGVVLEAMALGLVPLVVDYGGPAELVPSECGVTVPMGSREEIIARFSKALEGLLKDRERLQQMSQNSQDFVRRRFTWQAKAKQMLEVYKWVLGRRKQKPNFGMPFSYSKVEPT